MKKRKRLLSPYPKNGVFWKSSKKGKPTVGKRERKGKEKNKTSKSEK
jgi:hypothetical protein